MILVSCSSVCPMTMTMTVKLAQENGVSSKTILKSR